MNRTTTWRLVLLLIPLLGLSGCSQLARVMYRPDFRVTSRNVPANHSRAVLAHYIDPATRRTEEGNDGQTEPDAPLENKPALKPSLLDPREPEETPAAPAQSYTAPGLPYQQLAMAVSSAVVASDAAMSDVAEVRRDLVDSLAFSETGAVGRLGLTAPPTQLGGRVTSRPGLQDGPATGLGFAARDRNIFSAQANRLTGSNGRCRDLASAGFFGGNRAGCEAALRR